MKRSWVPPLLIGLLVAVACGSPAGDGGMDHDSTDSDGVHTGGTATGGTGDGGGNSGGSPSGGSAGAGTGGTPEGESGGMGGGSTPDAATFCDEYSAAVCDWAERCGWESCEDWGGYQFSKRECNDAIASLDGGFLTFDAGAVASCVEAIEGHACGAPPFFAAAVTTVCGPVFLGTVGDGDACTASDNFGIFDECESGFCLRPQGPQGGLECLGTCKPFKQDGETCAEGDRCAMGLSCANGKCAPLSQLGEDCDGDTPCVSGLTCSGEGTAPTCRAEGEVGSTCEDSFDCRWPAVCQDDVCMVDLPEGSPCRNLDSCEWGLYCKGSSSDDNVCAIPIAAGEPCGVDEECEQDYQCSPEEPYLCVPSRGGEDEPCGPAGCEPPLWCDTSDDTCRTPGGEGADCPSYEACASGLTCMSDSKCHAFGGLDAPCNPELSDNTCAEGFFCDRETALCKAPRGEGEMCSPLLALASCEEGLYCACLSASCPYGDTQHDPADVCVAQKDDGATCLVGTECSSDICINGECLAAVPVAQNCSR